MYANDSEKSRKLCLLQGDRGMTSSILNLNPDVIYAAMQRVMGYRPKALLCELILPEAGQERIELETVGSEVVLRGSSIPALGFSFHWYLTRYAGGQFYH